MAHVVTENCINCKHTDCVEVCPVDCFHEGPNFLVIDPAGVLRIATSLDAAELVALLCAEGCPVASDQVLVLPSICCGGCSG